MNSIRSYLNKAYRYLRANYRSLLGPITLAILLLPSRFTIIQELIVALSVCFFITIRLIGWYRLRKDLKARGLTLQDVRNTNFLKRWEQTRKTGSKVYALRIGGLMLGVILLIPISFSVLYIGGLKAFMSSVTNAALMSFSWLFTSYVLGVSIYFIRWYVNERRFQRLTDPLFLLEKR